MIVNQLAAEIRKAATSAQLAVKLQEFGAEGAPMAPDEFSRYWKEQVALYRKIFSDANIKLEAG